jgi:hypothetical protein
LLKKQHAGMKQLKISKTIQWMIKLFTIYLLVFTAFRIVTVILFKPENISVLQLGPSFWLGLKYDLRWIAIALSPIIVLSVFKPFSPFHSANTKKLPSHHHPYNNVFLRR